MVPITAQQHQQQRSSCNSSTDRDRPSNNMYVIHDGVYLYEQQRVCHESGSWWQCWNYITGAVSRYILATGLASDDSAELSQAEESGA